MRDKKSYRKYGNRLVYALLIGVMTWNLVTCSKITKSGNVKDWMKGVAKQEVKGKEADSDFINGTLDFSMELFKQSMDDKDNSMVSPISVLLAMAMTANGADNQTLLEMEEVLGGGLSIEELNSYLYDYASSLPNEEKLKIQIANSIWFRKEEGRLTVKSDFLQRNADYYQASIYESLFDNSTLKEINKWVESNTDGMVQKILDEISESAVMYLINATAFDAEWETVYEENQVHPGIFTDIEGNKQNVDFMYSEETVYLDDGKAIGFMKPYANGRYGFVALLPNENLGEYMESLTGEGFVDILSRAANTSVNAALPKFSFDYSIDMKDVLISMGMVGAFSEEDADFTKLGSSKNGNLYVNKVIHNTFVSVDERGTKAGAATAVEVMDGGAAMVEPKLVKLDRPFIYAIVDNETKLPIFMGVLNAAL